MENNRILFYDAIYMNNYGVDINQYESYSYLTDGHGTSINGINSRYFDWFRIYVAIATI